MKYQCTILGLFILIISFINCNGNKYSKEMNTNLHDLKDPLRMAKLNAIWEKGRRYLSEPKLKKLLSELKIQDHEELSFKKLKSSGGDKEGLKEAQLRRQLLSITSKYGITDPVDSPKESFNNQKLDKVMFNDKKLHKLWVKAEQSGFTEIELKALKEEFQHHQDKIEEYHSLIDQMSGSENDVTSIVNDIHSLDNLEGSVKDYNDNINRLRQQHKDLKKGYSELHHKATSGPDSKEFIEPKVAGLWKLALRSDFTREELDSLHTELKHYESRLFKLRHLEVEMTKVSLDKLDDFSLDDQEKILRDNNDGGNILKERLEKQKRKVEKLHTDLEMRIVNRHTEF